MDLAPATPAERQAVLPGDERLLAHRVGDVVPDWGGADATFTLAALEPPRLLLYTSTRGRTHLTWCLAVRPQGRAGSRVHLRLRLGPVRHRRVAEVLGGAFDALTVAGLGAGLRERVQR